MFRYPLVTAILVVFGTLYATASPAGEAKSRKATLNDSERIQGTWTVVELHQVVHQPTEEEKEFLKTGKFKVTITADKLIFSPDKSEANYKLDPSQKPKVMNFYDPESKSRKPMGLAIYELKGDGLKICFGRTPREGEPELPSGFDIKQAKPGTFPTLLVLNRDRTSERERRYDAAALAKAVAPFVDETTVGVLHGDMSRLDTAPFVSMALELLPGVESSSQEEKAEAAAKVNTILATLAREGCNDVYLVVNLRPTEYPVMLIVPLAEGMEESAVAAILDEAGWIGAARLHGAFFAGDPRTRERLEAHRPDPRPQLVAALKAVGDSGGQMVILPPKHVAPLVEMMLPALPEELRGGPIRALVRYLKSVKFEAYGLNTSPEKSLTMVIQAENDQAAAALHQDWIEFSRILKENAELRAILPNLDEVIALFTPKADGDRLILSINKPDQVDTLLDAMQRLVKGWDRLLAPTQDSSTGDAKDSPN